MTIAPGTRLGPYEIQSPLGAGGMGEVYKVRDTRLERAVAVKVLPEAFFENKESIARFEREAKSLAAVSHPHIAALYSFEEVSGRHLLVMELADGETLSERLVKGPLPVPTALTLGMEIASALDAAHRAGIVHRDLKPGNVMLTKSGVKLLDFGLAKFRPAPHEAVSGVSRLATEAKPGAPLTEKGTVLGTFQYMAPEQLEGKEADARSDIFSFGAVLYEMVTGRKAFEGKSQASLIGSILRDEPPAPSGFAPMSPPALDRVVKTCLSKDPEGRFQTAHDVRLQLQWISEGGSQAGLPAPVAAHRRNREKLAWTVAGLALLAALALGIGFVRRAPSPKRTIRFEIPMPEGITTIDAPRISPDGRYLAFNATDSSGKNRIWVRALSDLAAHPLEGTEGATRPFWSPDSRSLGFVAEGKLKKIEVSGGPAQKICDAPTGSDGTWSPEGVILYDGTQTDPIRRVSAAGGTPVVAVKPDPSRKETTVAWPEFLPDGRHFLFLATGEKPEDNAYRIGALDSTESKALAPAQTLVSYAPPGYLLFVRDRTLVAQPFDVKALKMSGEPVPLAEHVGTDAVGLARFSVSRDGTLVYRTGESGNRIVWLDRTGREAEGIGDPGEYANPAFSPGGDRLAFDLNDPRSGRRDIWVRDLKRGVSSRFTFGPGNSRAPLWSPDGRTIVYTRDQDLFEKPADGQGEEKPLLKSDEFKVACDWTRDGRTIVFLTLSKETGWDIWQLPMSGDRKPLPLLNTKFNELLPVLSPDGQFLAYVSNESGRAEVYVQSFPGPGGKWQLSTSGGTEPHWRADGRELYYRAPDQKVMAVEIRTAGGLAAGVPQPLFAARFVSGLMRSRYLPAADGRRFLVLSMLGREAMTPTTVVLNWTGGLTSK